MTLTKRFRRNSIPVAVLALLCLAGCTGTGYRQIGGEWFYVILGSVGDEPQKLRLDVDPDTFQYFEREGYAKDKNKVFYEGQVIERTDATSFIVDDEIYARDNNHVYFQGVIVQRADPRTFVSLGFPYGKDGKHGFCGTLPMLVDDLNSFRVTVQSKNVDESAGGFDPFDELKDYPLALDPSIGMIYDTMCEARTDNQWFRGPIRIK